MNNENFKLCVADHEGKRMFFGSASYEYADSGTVDFLLTVGEVENQLDGPKSLGGYFQSLLLKPYKVTEDTLNSGPRPLDFPSIELARKKVEGYVDSTKMGERMFGAPVKLQDIIVATIDEPENEFYIPIEKTVEYIPFLMQLEILSALEKMERVSRGGVDPKILDIGNASKRSKTDAELFERGAHPDGRWIIGTSEETRKEATGKIYSLSSKVTVQKTGSY